MNINTDHVMNGNFCQTCHNFTSKSIKCIIVHKTSTETTSLGLISSPTTITNVGQVGSEESTSFQMFPPLLAVFLT